MTQLDTFAVVTPNHKLLKHVKAWLNFWSRPPREDKLVFLLRPRILILKVAKLFRETFFRGVELVRVKVM